MNNTVTRTISGIAFIATIVLCLLLSKYLFGWLMLSIEIGLMIEFYRMTMGARYKFSRILAILTGVTLFILIFCVCTFNLEFRYVGLALFPALLVMINSLYVKDKTEFWRFSFIYTAFIYISIPIALSNLLVFHYGEFDGLPMLSFFIIIWASDVGGYVFGCSLGKKYPKKLFPAISPKKTWVGFFGGFICSVATAILLRAVGMIDYPMFSCIVLAMVMDIAGVYGDLFESQWKRCYDIKDSGSVIPGHGGLMDRFDSSIFAIPAGVMYLVLFNLM